MSVPTWERIVGNIGVIIVLLLIGGGLVWLFVRALRGKEVDRRVVFAFILISVAAPLLLTITFEMKPTHIVQELYDKIDNLPAGSRILLSFDFDPPMAPEVQPMADVVSRHVLTRGHKAVFMTLWATGQAQFNITLEDVIRRQFPNAVYGEHYVDLGYKAGNEGVLNVIRTDFKKMFPTDVNTVPWDSLPILEGIRSCSDFDLIISLGGGKPGVKEWVLFVGDPTGVPVAGGVAAVVAPMLYPYFPSQMCGLLGGIKGAAEYENYFRDNHPDHTDMETPAMIMMGPQTVAHVVILAFIVIGNVLFFVNRRKEVKR
ncbi:MAG: hypothetical protein AB1772_03210 [Candidatus Zixiibacteriota bacterium]